MAAPEVGMTVVPVAADPLFVGVPALCTCFQWHGAEVKTLPPGATLLASSPLCPVQAFKLGDNAYGLQFHMELTATTAEEWGALPEYAAALERVQGPGALPALQADVARNFPALQSAAYAIFGNFLRLAK
jgi:GMP synthase-like glutamine amidotransferase